MLGPQVAVVDGRQGLGLQAGLLPPAVLHDLLHQAQLGGPGLVVTADVRLQDPMEG